MIKYPRLVMLMAAISLAMASSGQEIIRSTLSSAGSSAYNGGLFIRQTFGQPPATLVFTTEFGILRQGFQQSVDIPPVTYAPMPDELKPGELYFRMYPNPARDHVYIDLVDEADNPELIITDMYGKRVYHRTGLSGPSVSVTLQQFTSGIYFITVTDQSRRGTQKLIVL
ncbi:MAG: T9SS C-terminal target domain-containing protein [Marinilabiliales bacterium]|nr:MAG: T9SS C-terminal target domain-containing protein [Marinilabiliales bacterium]